MDCSTPGFTALHYLQEFAQIHIHCLCYKSPLSQLCHSTISSSVTPFFSCPQSSIASGSFPVSQFFPWGGQSTGVSASASVLPMNIQGWFPLGLTGLISLLSKGLSRVFSSTTIQSINSLVLSLLYGSILKFVHVYWKNHSFLYTDLCQKMWCLYFLNHCLGLS